ncbi:MAG TPA: FAD-dependent monooxygenase [Pseudolabrys sp.]|nr:FAD-dependent monooxygenase [Pseudolabrys sp.]
MPGKSPHILIAGGGIGGLTTALALLRRGIDVDVYEQAPELREVGAGLQIGPNGSRLLIELGLREPLEEVVCEAARKEVRLWNTGQTWKLFDLGRDCIERFDAPYWCVHRGDIHNVLRDAVLAQKPDAIHLSRQATGFTQGRDGIVLHLGGGHPDVRGDAIVAADGVHSRLREAAGIVDKTFFTGIMAWRGLVPAERLPEESRALVGTNWVGPGAHVITYPLRRGELMNFVGVVEGRDWPIESWTESGTLEECLADFKNWHPTVQQTIRGLDVPFKWAFVGREPLTRWAFGRMCMIGDACHPTLPFLAQGANMAIEDAVVVARAIAASPRDIEGALRRFESLRIERTTKIVRGSTETAKRFHNPVLSDHDKAVDYVTREWEPERVRTRYDWLFEYDARTVDVAPSGAAPAASAQSA